MRHDGKPDLPEPYKSIAWSFGRLAAVLRGTADAFQRLATALNDGDLEATEDRS